jgi:hypothetical protein
VTNAYVTTIGEAVVFVNASEIDVNPLVGPIGVIPATVALDQLRVAAGVADVPV